MGLLTPSGQNSAPLPASVQAVNAQLAADPVYQKLVKTWHDAMQVPGAKGMQTPAVASAVRAVQAYLKTQNIPLPDKSSDSPAGYSIGPQGDIVRITPVSWKDIAEVAALPIGGAAIGSVIGGAAVPSTAPVAGEGALGIPTTAGVTGADFGGAAATVAPEALPGAVAAATSTAAIPTTLGVNGTEFGGTAATQAPDALPAGFAGAAPGAAPSGMGQPGSEGYAPGDITNGNIPTADTGSTLSRVQQLLKSRGQGQGSTLDDVLGATGKGVGDAATAAGNNRLTTGELALKAQQVGNQTAQTNTQGQSAYESELLARSKDEQAQRSDALKNIYRESYATNRTPGPYNAKGLTPYSPEYLAALKDLATQGGVKLSKTAQFDSNANPVLAPYVPVEGGNFDPKAFMDQYGQQGTLEKASNWLSPTLSTIGTVGKVSGWW